MACEVGIDGIEDRLLAKAVAEHGGLEVVDHNLAGDAAKSVKGVLVTGQEVLHGLGHRELGVNYSAVAQNHDEDAEFARCRANPDGSAGAPVDLGAFARSEAELEIRLGAFGPDLGNVLLEDGVAALISLAFDPVQDLGGGVGMVLQHTHDGVFVWIKLAGPTSRSALPVALLLQPLGHCTWIQFQFLTDLGWSEAFLLVIMPDPGVEFVVDHGRAPRSLLRISET